MMTIIASYAFLRKGIGYEMPYLRSDLPDGP